ncbi:MAG: haloacid dehalogenase-like hydrolase [Candidatus Methanomethylophilaceae archaeon]|nr:haloacid dehalogenase-like hydrolase [Candidatus Methanomethylophilaceae archaeon]
MVDNEVKVWRAVTAVAVVLLVAVSAVALTAQHEDVEERVSGAGTLSYWADGSEAKDKLVTYVQNVTDEGSDDFIPVASRIAVFDFDGTLFCETDPNYFDYTLLVYRVLQDPDYIDRATDFEKAVANKIVEQNETGKSFPELPVEHGQAVASAFAGMTIEQFDAYIQAFKGLPMPSYDGMLRGDGWYLPMKQVIEYLQGNGFTVYIVSGTDRFIVRSIVNGSDVAVPNNLIIGSDESVVATHQAGEEGLDYTFASDDEAVLGGDFLIKNLKMNKTTAIIREIGAQPVLSFGNTTGDANMAMYTITDNSYRSMAFMLCCDDTERENGNLGKADRMYSLCDQYGWVPISMKDDWTTIYGDLVTYKG